MFRPVNDSRERTRPAHSYRLRDTSIVPDRGLFILVC